MPDLVTVAGGIPVTGRSGEPSARASWAEIAAAEPEMVVVAPCGYHLAGRQLNDGNGRSIAVPTFLNRTTTYKVEQQLTEEVRRELIRRTHFKVTPEDTGDVIVTGEILAYNAVPVIFKACG